jgi:hypothetical protein
MLRTGDGRADIWPMAYGFGKPLADIFAAMRWGNSKTAAATIQFQSRGFLERAG